MLDIKVTPAILYEVQAPNGTTVAFRRTSEWEGFERWDCEMGSMIVTNTIDRGPFSKMFKNVFRFDSDTEEETFRVVKANPALVSLFEMDTTPPGTESKEAS